MANHQMLAPGKAGLTTIVNGRSYTGVLGTPRLIPSFDALALEANGWIRGSKGAAGTTALRPTAPKTGEFYLDTTLGYNVVWDGVLWRNPATGSSV